MGGYAETPDLFLIPEGSRSIHACQPESNPGPPLPILFTLLTMRAQKRRMALQESGALATACFLVGV